MQIDEQISRRDDRDRWTPAEKAILDAIKLVRGLGVHPHLVYAFVLLSRARSKVADFVDGVEVDANLVAQEAAMRLVIDRVEKEISQ